MKLFGRGCTECRKWHGPILDIADGKVGENLPPHQSLLKRLLLVLFQAWKIFLDWEEGYAQAWVRRLELGDIMGAIRAVASHVVRKRSLADMWHALRVSKIACAKQVEVKSGVVCDLLNARYQSGTRPSEYLG